jgi:hypothetical protein
MGEYSNTFDWVQFPEGRARFAGGTRGWDERGHETFAVDVDGVEYFGEIRHAFLPNGNDFNIEIVSFGYRDEIYAGSPPPHDPFTADELKVVQSLILQLIRSGLHRADEDKPLVLDEDPGSRFMGKVIFREGWATERRGNEGVAQRDAADMEVER